MQQPLFPPPSGQAQPVGRHRRIPSSAATEAVSVFGVVDESTKPCEQDPTGRYIRYPMLLGRGACKRVFRAFDCEDGVEVAWNQVELAGVEITEATRERLFEEIQVLQQLHHKNIMSFHSYWYNPKLKTLNFITEIFMSGTLRQYRKKVCVMNENILKRWAWQILEGLVYLHGHDPPIVHRDLKCDNIFVNGNTGQIKIGDLGYATAQQGLSVVGTPEFMAPEIYEERYDHKVDIYSFGMCLLELATLEFPYSECHGVAQIFRKVTQGVKPQALQRVMSEQLRQIIELCIAHDPTQRPDARILLKHPFFAALRAEPGNGFAIGSFQYSTTNLAALSHIPVSGAMGQLQPQQVQAPQQLPVPPTLTSGKARAGATPLPLLGSPGKAAPEASMPDPGTPSPASGGAGTASGGGASAAALRREQLPDGPLCMESLCMESTLSHVLDRRDRLHQSVNISELAQQLHKHDGQGSRGLGDECEDGMSESSDEVVIIPFQCLASMDDDDDDSLRTSAGGAAEPGVDDVDVLGGDDVLSDLGPPQWSCARTSVPMLSSAASLMTLPSNHCSPSLSRAASYNARAHAARSLSPALSACYPALPSPQPALPLGINRDLNLNLPPLSPSSSMSFLALEAFLPSVPRPDTGKPATVNIQGGITSPLAGETSCQRGAPSPFSFILPPACASPAASQPSACPPPQSPSTMMATPMQQQPRRAPLESFHTLPLPLMTPSSPQSTSRPASPAPSHLSYHQHQSHVSSPQVLVDFESPQAESGSASRPIHGVIVRLKQCKGQGFSPNVSSDRFRRGTTM